MINADPVTVARAVRAVTPGDMLTLRPPVFVRSLPARLSRAGGERYVDRGAPVLDGPIEGVGAVILAQVPDGDLVVGVAGAPWGPRQRWLTLTPQEFGGFDEPGHIEGLLAFSLVPDGRGTRLHTETRVCATDRRSARRFRFSWALIEPFSSLIRRDWLAAAARAAEGISTRTGPARRWLAGSG